MGIGVLVLALYGGLAVLAQWPKAQQKSGNRATLRRLRVMPANLGWRPHSFSSQNALFGCLALVYRRHRGAPLELWYGKAPDIGNRPGLAVRIEANSRIDTADLAQENRAAPRCKLIGRKRVLGDIE